MVGNIEYVIPTWNQIYELMLGQAQKIRQEFSPDIVVGVARGGLVPARVLCDLLETHQLATIRIEFYTDIATIAKEPILKQPLSLSVVGERVLLVDDIADTGRSLAKAVAYLYEQGACEVKTATLYYKPQSVTLPDFYEKQTLGWVVFPWEIKETLRKITQKAEGKRVLNQEIAKLVKAGLPKQLTEKLLNEML